MRLLEQTFNAIAFSIANPMPGERSYTELIMRSSDTKPKSYRWLNNAQKTRAAEATQELNRLMRHGDTV